MKNYRGGGSKYRQVVTAAAPRSGGSPVVEDGFAGMVEVDAASGQRYALRRDGEFEVPFVSGAQKGHTVYINETSFALTTAAFGTAPGAGTRAFGRVSAVPGNSNTGNSAEEPKTGKMWITLGATEDRA